VNVDKDEFYKMVAAMGVENPTPPTSKAPPKQAKPKKAKPAPEKDKGAPYVNYVRTPAPDPEFEDVMTPEGFMKMLARVQRDHAQAPHPRRRLQPRVTRMESARQRRALGQTDNEVRAIYNGDGMATPIRRTPEGLTLKVGPGCQNPNTHSHGKATRERRPGDEYGPAM
jgi:hypothetical protein